MYNKLLLRTIYVYNTYKQKDMSIRKLHSESVFNTYPRDVCVHNLTFSTIFYIGIFMATFYAIPFWTICANNTHSLKIKNGDG